MIDILLGNSNSYDICTCYRGSRVAIIDITLMEMTRLRKWRERGLRRPFRPNVENKVI
jgi:hypothetical protein